MTGADPRQPGWVVVVPLKPLDRAKTRLSQALGPDLRAQVTLAMLLDTVAAAASCPAVRQVVVVTDDDTARQAARAAGALVVADQPRAGLDAAVSHAAELVAQQFPGARLAVLAGDLPALRPAELDLALSAAGGHARTVVADATGTGTTLLTACTAGELAPSYGAGSLQRHHAAGAVVLDVDAPGLRRDVDTGDDLAEALRLGVGARTAAALGRAAPGVYGTVADFDPGTGTGTVRLDAGPDLRFPAPAFAASGLRLLRRGQRVLVLLDAAGTPTLVTIPTLRAAGTGGGAQRPEPTG